MAQLPRLVPSRVIDFSSPSQLPNFACQRQLRFGRITLTRGTLLPNPGVNLGAEQVIVARHCGIPVQLDWRPPGTDVVSSKLMAQGTVHVKAAREQFWQRWSIPADVLVIAFDPIFFDQLSAEVVGDSFKGLIGELGIDDAGLSQLTGLFDREFLEGGLNGRFYVENLGAALAAYLVRRRAGKPVATLFREVRVAPMVLRRVIEYIDAHLDNDLSLEEISAVAGLNTHHFAHAFKATTGVPPHRFIINRRVQAARLRLETTKDSIAEIAVTFGFASQSHFTQVFRRVIGMTPAQYRRQL